MQNVSDNIIRKISFRKYFYMLMLFLWCAYTAPFLKPFDTQYMISSSIYIVIYVFYFVTYCFRKNNRALFIVLSIFGIWYIAQCVKHSQLVSIDFRLIYSVILCHIAFYLYKGKEFFLYFEKVLVHLTILSLGVWLSGILFSSITHSIFDVISVWNNGTTTYGNIIVVALGDQYVVGILRNIGFTWEAGRFSSFLALGMFFSLLLHNMQISGNKSFWVFTIGLISTVSTTGIIAASIVLWTYLYNTRGISKYFFIFICIMCIPLLWGLDFIGGKLLTSSNVAQEIENMQWMYDHGDNTITPQRFTGLYLDFQNWIHDFWLGYNINANSYAQKVIFGGNEVWLSNGLIQILSKYGTLIGLFFYYCLLKSSKKIISDFHYKGAYSFAMLFMLISVSYDFWSSGIFLYFVLYWLYRKYMV